MQPCSIIVAEDDTVLGESLCAMLRDLGYEVAAWVDNGPDAVVAGRSVEADLALFDVRLPGDFDGIEAARRLRDEVRLPVVFVTGDDDSATLERARQAGSYGFVVEPYTPRELDIALRMALARAEDERRLADREKHYRAVYEESEMATVLLSRAGVITDANHAFARALGYREVEALIGRPLSDLFASRESGARELLRPLSRGSVVRGREIAMRARDGSRLWMLCGAKLVAGTGVGSGDVVVATFIDVTRRKETEDELMELAYRDPLTGLPNRRLLDLRGGQLIEESKRRGECSAFLYVDLVGFKKVNDRIGHSAGDEVLVRVADRLRGSLRAVDIAARMGGDEFGVLLSGAGDPVSARKAAERCFEGLSGDYTLESGSAPIQVRAGLAIFPDHGDQLSDLIAAADLALAAATARPEPGLVIALAHP